MALRHKYFKELKIINGNIKCSMVMGCLIIYKYNYSIKYLFLF